MPGNALAITSGSTPPRPFQHLDERADRWDGLTLDGTQRASSPSRRPSPEARYDRPMTVYFMAPDRTGPVGGIRVIYGMVRALEEAGIKSAVWQNDAEAVGWALSLRAPVIFGKSLELTRGDRLVVPEATAPSWREINEELPVIVLNQGHYNTLGGASPSADVSGPYPLWRGVSAVVATSEAITDFLNELCLGVPVFSVRLWTDVMEDAPPSGERELLVSFMVNRPTSAPYSIMNAVRRDAAFSAWRWNAIVDLPPAAVRQTLGRSAVFFHGGQREGFGLPALEAMAAGAYLIGFTGDGARELMRSDLCTILPDDNLAAAVRLTKQALSSPGMRAERAQAARAWVASSYGWSQFVSRCAKIFAGLPTTSTIEVPSQAIHVSHMEARRPNLRRRLGLARDALLR